MRHLIMVGACYLDTILRKDPKLPVFFLLIQD